MRFLIDRCAGRRLADWLREHEHDVSESREHQDPGDAAILAWASAEQRILISMNKDFGELIFLRRQRHCGLIRRPDVPARERIVLVEQILLQHGADLEAGAVITVRGDRIRISRPW